MKKSKNENNERMTLSSLAAYVEEVLNKGNFSFTKDEDDSFYRISFSSDPIDIDVAIQYNDNIHFLCVYAAPEYRVPKDKIKKLLPKINQINLETFGPCLRIDEEDGLLSSTMFINTDGGITNPNILGIAISQCFQVISNNFNSLMEVIYNKDTGDFLSSTFEKMSEDKKSIES